MKQSGRLEQTSILNYEGFLHGSIKLDSIETTACLRIQSAPNTTLP